MWLPLFFIHFNYTEAEVNDALYDPTNGTIASGDIPTYGGMVQAEIYALTAW